MEDLYKKYSSKKWIYGEYSDKGLEISKNFPWGNVALNVLIKDKIIENICLSTDALETEIFDDIMKALKDKCFEKETVIKLFNEYNGNVAKDIRNLILSNIK